MRCTFLVASAALELAGAAAFAVVVAGTVSAGRREVYDGFLLAAVAWLAAASVANLVVLVDAVSAGAAVIAQARDTPLLAMYLYGFITLIIFGISLRILPAFLHLRPPHRAALTPALLVFNAGLCLRVAVGWSEAYAGFEPPAVVESTAVYLLATAVLLFAIGLNVYLPSMKGGDDFPERADPKLIRAAYVWLAVAAGLEVWLTTRRLVGGEALDFLEAGAARHSQEAEHSVRQPFAAVVFSTPAQKRPVQPVPRRGNPRVIFQRAAFAWTTLPITPTVSG